MKTRLKNKIVKTASLRPMNQIEFPKVPNANVEIVQFAAAHLATVSAYCRCCKL